MKQRDLIRASAILTNYPGRTRMVRLADSGLALEYEWPGGICEYIRSLSGAKNLAQRIVDGEPPPLESEQALIVPE